MGWLGWTEQEVLDTSIPALEHAIAGKIEMLQAVFGNGEGDSAPPKKLAIPKEPPKSADIMAAFRAAAGSKKARKR